MTNLDPTPRALRTLAAALGALAAVQATAADRHPRDARARAHAQIHPGAHATAHDSFETTDAIEDADGTRHVRLQRRFQGLRVLGGELVVQLDANDRAHRIFTSQRGPLVLQTTQASLPLATAELVALSRGSPSARAAAAETVVWAPPDAAARLAYLVRAREPAGRLPETSRTVVVDAHSAQVLATWSDSHTAAVAGRALGRTYFSGSFTFDAVVHDGGAGLWETYDPFRKLHVRDLRGLTLTLGDVGGVLGVISNPSVAVTSTTGVFGATGVARPDTLAADVVLGLTRSFDFYRTHLQRVGYDNKGTKLNAYVNVGVDYQNAKWEPACNCLMFGNGAAVQPPADGSGASTWVKQPMVAMDIVAHEYTHGVTASSANLIYFAEYGGLNEATSDIMAKAIEFQFNSAANPPNWIVGKRIATAGFGTLTSGFRNMARPSEDGRSVDCYSTMVKSLGVHAASGPANHFYYLLSQGTAGDGSAARPGSRTCKPTDMLTATGSGVLTGIGTLKAARIWYRALTTKFTPLTNYYSARQGTQAAAEELFGVASPEALAVSAAWDAVNVPR